MCKKDIFTYFYAFIMYFVMVNFFQATEEKINMITKKLAIFVLNETLATGADFAEIYIQEKNDRNIVLSNKRVDTLSQNLIFGIGIRLFKDKKSVYGYTSDMTKSSLIQLARKLALSFDGERIVTVDKLTKVHNPKHHQPKIAHSEMSTEDKLKFMRQGEKAMYESSSLTVNARVGLTEWDEKVWIFNSKGRFVTDTRCHTRFVMVSTANRDGDFQVGFYKKSDSKGLELFDEFDIEKEAEIISQDAIEMLDAPECPSGKMTVIIDNGFGGVIFHEACGHPLEGNSISHNTSVFAGKLGEKIASSIVSAVDDGTIESGWGSSNFDDEGEKTTKNVLIKNGVLTNYMMDNFEGRRMGRNSTGACRRESYKFVPTTRMTNTYICNGKSSKEDIIKNTKYGLYVVALNGGSVNPTTDKFNFTASKAYIIKDGEILHLVKDAAIVGYGYEILKNIDMVGNNLAFGDGMCGASSGMIPANVGQPTIRVKNLTVGGRGGNL